MATGTGRISAMLFEDLADRFGLCAFFVLGEGWNVGRRWRRRCSHDVFENPLAAKHGRCAVGIRRHGQDAALTKQTTPRRVLYGHAAEVRAIDVRKTVMLRKSIVNERVVGCQQIDNVVILANDALKQHLGLFAKRLAKVVVEVWKYFVVGP